MCITVETLKEIETSLAEFEKLTNNPAIMLKDSFPDVRFIRMSASDIDEPPFRALDHYNLYLLDTREHCAQITNDLARATGVVLAQR